MTTPLVVTNNTPVSHLLRIGQLPLLGLLPGFDRMGWAGERHRRKLARQVARDWSTPPKRRAGPSMFHYLTLGHFDPDLIYPWRRLCVKRPLTPEEISAVEHAVKESVGHPVDLGAALQPNGVLRILWLGDRRQAAIAMAVADAAHRLLGAVAADREHAEVVVPGRRGPPWPRLTFQFFMEGQARELIVDRPISAEDIAALKRVASEACGGPAGLYLTEKSDGAYLFRWLGEPGAEAILSAAERLFGTFAQEIPASRNYLRK